MESQELMDLYTLVEMAYRDTFLNKAEDESELFPEGWYQNTNYQKKIEVLTEALDKDILIVYTDSYQTMLEGIRMVKS